MPGDLVPEDSKPIPALRIGVTGTREIGASEEARICSEVADVLRRIRAICAELARNPAAANVYRGLAKRDPTDDTSAFTLRIVSPLAEGADRLVAAEGLELGCELIAPLPFEQSDYEKDFPHSLDAFRRLLAAGRPIELDGGRGDDETASYEAVGRFVVQNSDLVIAIWNGHLTGKRGGTAEITRYAAEVGVPVWWINPDVDCGARWIGDYAEWTDRRDRAAETAGRSLDAYVSKLILPPILETGEEENLIGRTAHHVRRLTDVHDDPLLTFLTESGRPDRGLVTWIWKSYSRAYAGIAPRQHIANARVAPPPDFVEPYWNALCDRADRLSIEYADRYRSSYLLIIVFAFLIGLASVMGSMLPAWAALPSAIMEFSLLVAIAALAVLNHVGSWHERWINYRLLAELCRGQAILAPLGEKLPRPEITRGAAVDAEKEPEAFSREVWVPWFVEAVSRGSPWQTRNPTTAKLQAKSQGLQLAISQIAYHQQRSVRSEIADARLGQAGETCFFMTVIAISLRLVLLLFFHDLHALSEIIEGLATLLSTASAAFVAIRFYAEFGLLDRQSQRMQRNMEDAERELEAVTLDQPLASLDLGKALQRLSASMLLDIAGWAELFRIRAVEAG